MSQPPVTTQIHQTFNIHANYATQITLNLILRINYIANAANLCPAWVKGREINSLAHL